MDSNDFYEILGLGPDATSQQLKEAYRHLALQYHPDRNASNPEAVEKMKALNEAYAVLSDPSKRKQYDTLRRQYGHSAYGHFRQSYSDQDIFRGSDIHQIFEEMAHAFGLRGFDEIVREFYGQNGVGRFEFQKPGMHARGFIFRSGAGSRAAQTGQSAPPRIIESLARKLLHRVTGIELPQKGADIRDNIDLPPDFAKQGGAYAYFHRLHNKKLVVHIPPGVTQGRKIRLAGMGHAGRGGAEAGDLYLHVKIKMPLLRKLKTLLGWKN
jgi:DnaJ-class molecular chaperone